MQKLKAKLTPLIAGGPERGDTLYGTGASDRIKGLGGVDHIYAANGGNDFIEAGGGDGWGTANAQPDAYFSDYVEAGAGADHIYAHSYIDTAIAQGNANLIGLRWRLIAANDGEIKAGRVAA